MPNTLADRARGNFERCCGVSSLLQTPQHCQVLFEQWRRPLVVTLLHRQCPETVEGSRDVGLVVQLPGEFEHLFVRRLRPLCITLALREPSQTLRSPLPASTMLSGHRQRGLAESFDPLAEVGSGEPEPPQRCAKSQRQFALPPSRVPTKAPLSGCRVPPPAALPRASAGDPASPGSALFRQNQEEGGVSFLHLPGFFALVQFLPGVLADGLENLVAHRSLAGRSGHHERLIHQPDEKIENLVLFDAAARTHLFGSIRLNTQQDSESAANSMLV